MEGMHKREEECIEAGMIKTITDDVEAALKENSDTNENAEGKLDILGYTHNVKLLRVRRYRDDFTKRGCFHFYKKGRIFLELEIQDD